MPLGRERKIGAHNQYPSYHLNSLNDSLCETIMGMHMWDWMLYIDPNRYAVIIESLRCKLSSIIKPYIFNGMIKVVIEPASELSVLGV